jgi:hypothetical protein
MTQRVVRRSFTLTEKDLEIIKSAKERCGYISDSEALRAILKFFAEHASCLRKQ